MGDLERVRVVVSGLIKELRSKNHLPIKDISKLQDQDLIIWARLLHFYCADAIIRLLGVKNVEQEVDWWAAFDYASGFASGLDPDKLAKLYLQTRNEAAIFYLICFRLSFDRIKNEIKKRLETVPVGEKFLRLWGGENDKKALRDLCETTQKIIRAWVKSRKITLSPAMKEKIRGIAPQTAREEGPIETEDQNDALLAFYERFQRSIDGTNTGSVKEDFGLSPLAHSLPFSAWDAVAPLLLERDIIDHLQQVTHVISGKMEHAPFDVFNAFRKSNKKRIKRENIDYYDSYDRMLDLDEANDESRDRTLSKMKHKEWIEAGTEQQHRDHVLLTLDHILVEEKSRKAEKIRLAFELWLADQTQTEVAKKASITTRTLRAYVKKIKDRIKM